MFAILALTVMLLGLIIACSKPKDVGVGIYIDNYSDGFRGPVGIELEKLFGDKGTRRNAEGQSDKQFNQVNNDKNNALTGIVATLPDAEQTLRLIEIAKDLKLPIVTFSSEPSKLETFEAYDKAYLVSSNSKDAGVVDAQILERNFFGAEEGSIQGGEFKGIHSSDITPEWIKSQRDSGKLFNNIADWSKTGDTVKSIPVGGETAIDVPVLRTLLLEGDTQNWGSTDRTRAAIYSVNKFYDVLSQVESSMLDPESDNYDPEYDVDYGPIFPRINLTELPEDGGNEQLGKNGLKFSGADGTTGFFGYFETPFDGSGKRTFDPDEVHIARVPTTGILKYDQTRASDQGGNAAWSDTGSNAAMKAYLTGKDKTNALDVMIGASDQVTQGGVRALNEIGLNKEKESNPANIIPIVSTDGSADYGVGLLQDGQIWGTAEQSPSAMAKYVYTIMTNLLEDKAPLDGTDWAFDDSLNVNSSGKDGDKEHRVVNKIIRVPYLEFKLK